MLIEMHSFFYIISSLFFLALFIKLALFLFANQAKLPPSPPKLPVIGNFHQIGSLSHQSLQTLSKKYGPLMLLHFGSKPVLVISSAYVLSETIKTHDIAFSNRPQNTIFNKLLYNCKDVTFSNGDQWKHMRGLLVRNLLNNRMVDSFHCIRKEAIELMMENIKESRTVNLKEMFSQLTCDVIFRVTTGRKYPYDGDTELIDLTMEFFNCLFIFNVGDYIPWLSWVSRVNGVYRRVEASARKFDKFLEDLVEERMEKLKEKDIGEKNQQDVIDVLLEITRGDDNNGFQLTRDHMKALILDIFVAGTDTSSTLLHWAMTCLMKYPHIMKKVQKELRETTYGKSFVTEEDIEKMQYLRAVIKETLRLFPPAPLLVSRELSENLNLMGYRIEAGTHTIINAWAIERDPESWDDPEEFRPERFLDGKNNNLDYDGIAFGTGRRRCPGIQFAKRMNELTLANILVQFDFSLANGERGEDLDMTEMSGFVVQTKNPLVVVATLYGG